MALNCDDCGEDLHINPVDKPNVDWVKIVCSNCGNVENVSMIRLSATTHKRRNEE